MENVKDVPKVKKPLKATVVKDGEYNVSIVRDFYGKVDPFYLSKKDPKYAYRFLRDDKESGGKNLSIKTGNLLLQKGGWMLCSKTHLLSIGIKEQELSADGFLRRGDTILAMIPKALHAEKLKYKKEQADAPVSAVKRLIEKGDSTLAGIHPSMRGIEPKDKLKM